MLGWLAAGPRDRLRQPLLVASRGRIVDHDGLVAHSGVLSQPGKTHS